MKRGGGCGCLESCPGSSEVYLLVSIIKYSWMHKKGTVGPKQRFVFY